MTQRLTDKTFKAIQDRQTDRAATAGLKLSLQSGVHRRQAHEQGATHGDSGAFGAPFWAQSDVAYVWHMFGNYILVCLKALSCPAIQLPSQTLPIRNLFS